MRRGRAGVASTASVLSLPRHSITARTAVVAGAADDAYALATPAGKRLHLQKAALGAVLQPLIEVSGAARALAMNASPQPLRHAAVTAATGRVAS